MATANSTTPTSRSRPPSINLPAPPPLDTVPPLFIKDGTAFHEAPHSTVLRYARELARAQFRPGAPVLKDSDVLYDFVLLQLGSREREVFALVLWTCTTGSSTTSRSSEAPSTARPSTRVRS